MNDKNKIRAEIERLVKTEQGYDTAEAESAYRNCAKEILSFIDSMQEEPTSVWHDAIENPEPNKELICIGEFNNPLVLSSNSDSFKKRKIIKWAYFDDFLKLDNNSMQEEPVRSDLIKEIKRWLAKWPKTEMEWSKEDIWDTAEHFANWQKQQMMKNAVNAKVTEIYYPTDSCLEIEATLPENKFKDGDKVLIIKED